MTSHSVDGLSLSVVMKAGINALYLGIVLILQILYICFQMFFNNFSTNNQTNGLMFKGQDVISCV